MKPVSIGSVLLINLFIAVRTTVLLSSRGTLATVYAVRAIVSTALLMVLMARAERRGRRSAG